MSVQERDLTVGDSNNLELICCTLQDYVPHVYEQQENVEETQLADHTVFDSLTDWHTVLKKACHDAVHATGPTGGSFTAENLSRASQGKSHDYEIRTLTSLYNRLTRPITKQQKNKPKKGRETIENTEERRRNGPREKQQKTNQTTTIKLVLTSGFGVHRSVHSAKEWSELLLPLLDEHLPRSLDGCWDCRHATGTSGFITVLSPWKAAVLRQCGQRPCPSCPLWIKGGEKGLWWHQQQQHGVHHASATAFAASTRVTDAVMLFSGEQPTLAQILEQMSREAQEENDRAAKGKDTLLNKKEKAFHYAAQGDLESLKIAIQEGHVDPIHDIDNRGASLLLWAAGGGHVSIVRYLIDDCQCDPQKPQQQYKRGFAGRTALHWACRKGHLPVVQLLLTTCGPKILNDKTADGTTAIGWAAWQGQQEILEWIHENYSKEQSCVNMFLTMNKFGCNALLWAAQGTADPETTMAWLVQVAKVPILQTNSNGHGILHKAAQRNRPRVAGWLANFLVEKPPKAHMDQVLLLIGPDQEGCTPSDLAGIEGHLELASTVQKIECEIFQRLATCWPKSWKVDPTAVPGEWGPGCGVARLKLFHTEQESRQPLPMDEQSSSSSSSISI